MKPRRVTRPRLESLPAEVLAAAIAAENARPNCRRMYVQMLEAELKRRTPNHHKETSDGHA